MARGAEHRFCGTELAAGPLMHPTERAGTDRRGANATFGKRLHESTTGGLQTIAHLVTATRTCVLIVSCGSCVPANSATCMQGCQHLRYTGAHHRRALCGTQPSRHCVAHNLAALWSVWHPKASINEAAYKSALQAALAAAAQCLDAGGSSFDAS
jgi:hypothetical protein